MKLSMKACVLMAVLGSSACGNTEPQTDSNSTTPASNAMAMMDAAPDTMADMDAAVDLGGMQEDSGADSGGMDPADIGADLSEEEDASMTACAPGCSGDTPICDEGQNQCVGCLATSDCAEGDECDGATNTCITPTPEPDINGDGTLNILVIGTSRSLEQGGEPFIAAQIAAELALILGGDDEVSIPVNVVAEDVYASAPVLLGLGQGGTEYTWDHARHSLVQYYHWPEGKLEREANLAGNGGTDWDHVIIGADPHIVATLPGFYALGANTIAAKVAEGGAVPHLLMTWSRDEAQHDLFIEHTQRVSDRAKVHLPVIAAGHAWQMLSGDKKDTGSNHPSPNGAYLAAATIYASLYDRAASSSSYTYDDAIAQAAHDAYLTERARQAHDLEHGFMSPFVGAGIADRVLRYNHTGSSSERGILSGLQWILQRARVELINGGPDPITFNYGRANTNFEANKRYQLDTSRFLFSLGFPMQDHGGNGNTSMLYGIDRRLSNTENGTDLGVARYMVREGELPSARAIPIRTLYARMKEMNPMQSAYRDSWHMSRDLDKAAGAFMYTLLTGHCALDEEPQDTTSDAWRQWAAHKVGYETAWTLMHMSGVAPCFKVLPEATESVAISPTQSATLSISFMGAPSADVTVTLSSDNDAAVTYEPETLTFTPGNHNVPQVVTMTGVAGQPADASFVITASTSSSDTAFDGIEDRWRYAVTQD